MKTKKIFTLLPFMFAFVFVASAQTVDPFQMPTFPTMPSFQIPNIPTPDLPNNFPGGTNSNATSTVRVTTIKFIDGAMATVQSTNNTSFGVNATYNASNLGQGANTFSLAPFGYNGSFNAYQATTVPLSLGASYGVSEIMDSNTGTSCVATSSSSYKPFALVGYSVGNTLVEATNASIGTSAPNLTDLQTDKYIIIWNDNCATATSGAGTGALKVDSIETVNSSGIANDTFDNGFKYIFNITVPVNEPALYLKFSDWVVASSSGRIPAANNIRISSAQASSTTPVIVTGENIYTNPALTITSDLDPNMAGNQVKVLVETKIPAGTANGSYTTTYGVKTQ